MIIGCAEGVRGGGFLYTNKNSISLGCVYLASQLAEKKQPILQLYQKLKLHPAIASLIEGGKSAEYSAHLVSEAGNAGVPDIPGREGLLLVGDGAGLVINYGYSIRGIDLAVLSGIAAAQAIIQAETPSARLDLYVNEFKKTLLPAMKQAEALNQFLHIPRLYYQYPKLALDIMAKAYSITGRNEWLLRKQVLQLIKENHLSIRRVILDIFKGARSI